MSEETKGQMGNESDPKTDGSTQGSEKNMKKVISYIFYSSPAQTLVLRGGFRNPMTGEYTGPVAVRFHNGQVILRKDDFRVELLLNDSRCKKSEADTGSFWYGGRIIDDVAVAPKSDKLWAGPPPVAAPTQRAHKGAITTKPTIIKG